MRVILWAEIMANGFYPVYPTSFETPKEVWDDFYAHIAEAGNVILGRKTVEEMTAAGNGFGLGDAKVISVSRTPSSFEGATSAESPEAALDILRKAGHETALVGGGAGILNSYLEQGLAHELVLLIAPAIGGRESLVALPEGQHQKLQLLSCKELGSGVLKMHYRLE